MFQKRRIIFKSGLLKTRQLLPGILLYLKRERKGIGWYGLRNEQDPARKKGQTECDAEHHILAVFLLYFQYRMISENSYDEYRLPVMSVKPPWKRIVISPFRSLRSRKYICFR